MFKKIIPLVLMLLFVVTITLPSVIVMIDDTADISLFYSLSEEEEEKGNEKNKEFEYLAFSEEQTSSFLIKKKHIIMPVYTFKTYKLPHLNLISPPPEYHIL